MASNIEIKASIATGMLAHKRILAAAIADGPPELLRQADTFFPCPDGRLKLRQLSETYGELIFYRRPDIAGVKQSNYVVAATHSPRDLGSVLAAAYGTSIVVKKTRERYLVGQTRIHLDTVEGLGDFLELEVVLRDGQPPEDGDLIARNLMARLEVSDSDLLDCAYADLLSKKAAAA